MSRPIDVKQFYNEFSKSTLFEDFHRLNLRQEKIKSLCNRFIPPGAKILEIGCGVGIITKHIERRASEVVAIDISDMNVRFAALYVRSKKVVFRARDLLNGVDELKQYGPFNVVLLADVIEHIPKEKYKEVFKLIENILAKNGKVIITFP